INRMLRTKATRHVNFHTAKQGEEFVRSNRVLVAIFLDFADIFLDIVDQIFESIACEMVQQSPAAGQVLQGLPDRIERRCWVRAGQPPARGSRTEYVQHRRKDRMTARVIAVEQGKEEVSVHTKITEGRGGSAMRRGISRPSSVVF